MHVPGSGGQAERPERWRPCPEWEGSPPRPPAQPTWPLPGVLVVATGRVVPPTTRGQLQRLAFFFPTAPRSRRLSVSLSARSGRSPSLLRQPLWACLLPASESGGVGGRGLKEWGTKPAAARPICQAGGVFIIDGGSAAAAQLCSPAWVNETFFSKLLRFLIADCTRVTKLTQGSSMHAQ